MILSGADRERLWTLIIRRVLEGKVGRMEPNIADWGRWSGEVAKLKICGE